MSDEKAKRIIKQIENFKAFIIESMDEEIHGDFKHEDDFIDHCFKVFKDARTGDSGYNGYSNPDTYHASLIISNDSDIYHLASSCKCWAEFIISATKEFGALPNELRSTEINVAEMNDFIKGIHDREDLSDRSEENSPAGW